MIRPPELQADKFADLARELGCDEDDEAFRAKLRQIARAPKPEAEPDPPEALPE